MSSLIKILPDHIINRIAAGEVVERPASVVKELVENSIDAGATEILIDIEQAGTRLIRITDNGSGMSREDAQTAFQRHATSKITSDADLEAIRTMGFRGEALSSIASVSRIRLITAMKGAKSGVQCRIEGGTVEAMSDAAAPAGTLLEVSHLFFNTPARLKFLKSPATEFSHILTAISRLAMSHPAIRFTLSHNKKSVLDLPVCSGMTERVFQLYGNEIAQNVVDFAGGRDVIHVHGLLGRPGYSRGDKTYQDFYVNHRAVRNASLTHALYGAHGDMLMRDRHPVAFVFIEIDPALVDVNVHPAKAEVRFRNQSQVHDLVRDVMREGLRAAGGGMSTGLPASEIRAQGVREALAGYEDRRSARVEGQGMNIPSPFYGRRKSDGAAMPMHFGPPDRQELPLNPPVQPLNLSAREIVPLAQVHDSYILAQSSEGMVIIDQHAAHERVLFEQLQDQFRADSAVVQELLMPLQLELGPAQGTLLAGHLQEIRQLGFRVEDFGNGTFMIKGVPALLAGADHKQLLLDILDEMNVHGSGGKMDQRRNGVLSVMACHPAIKVHRHLDRREMEKLLDDLFACRMPHTCPHGRPTHVKYSLDEIRKMFKRI